MTSSIIANVHISLYSPLWFFVLFIFRNKSKAFKRLNGFDGNLASRSRYKNFASNDKGERRLSVPLDTFLRNNPDLVKHSFKYWLLYRRYVD